jgi:hypothetical protein
MFVAALLTIAKLWKCPTIDKWSKKMCVHAMECFSDIKRNEIMLFTGNWMNLENIILSKPGSKGQRSHVFPDMWKLDLKDKCICKYMYGHLCLCTYVFIYLSIHERGRERGRKRERESMIVLS